MGYSPPASAVSVKTSQWLLRGSTHDDRSVAGSEAVSRPKSGRAWTPGDVCDLGRNAQDRSPDPPHRHPSPSPRRSYILRAGISSLFRYIEGVHGEKDPGASWMPGTGEIASVDTDFAPTERWTAVTAARSSLADKTRAALGSAMRLRDRLLVGTGQTTPSAGDVRHHLGSDYPVGAIDTPCTGGGPRVRAVAPASRFDHGRLYLVGFGALRAIYRKPKVAKSSGKSRVRDACLLLLAGERPYREFPLDWMLGRLGLCASHSLARRHPLPSSGYVNVNSTCAWPESSDSLQRLKQCAYVEELRARALQLNERQTARQ